MMLNSIVSPDLLSVLLILFALLLVSARMLKLHMLYTIQSFIPAAHLCAPFDAWRSLHLSA